MPRICVDEIPLLHFKPLCPCDPVNYPRQGFQNIRPRLIDYKKINRKEDHGNDDDDRRVLHVIRRRERRAIQFGASLFYELADAFLFLSYCFRHVFSP